MTFALMCLILERLLVATPEVVAHVPEERLVERALGERTTREAPLPRFDPRLDEAAAILARQVLALPPEAPLQPLSSEALREALSLAGAFDPAPNAIVLRATSTAALAQAMASHPELSRARTTRFGISIVSRDGRAAGVALLSQRRVELDEFPRRAQVGQPCRVVGRIARPLKRPLVAVTDPGGAVHTLPVPLPQSGGEAARFEMDLTFHRAGVNAVELIAEGRYGPEVVALFEVEALDAAGGGQTRPARMADAEEGAPQARREKAETKDIAVAERQVVQAINDLRARHGLRPLQRDGRLDRLARHHAREMGRLKFFGHKSPKEGDVARRLSSAGIAYSVAAENLAESHSALDAQWLLEASPGHRGNLLMPEVTLVGVGTAPVPGRQGNLYLVEIFMRP